MEATLNFLPVAIVWSARGVNFKYSEDGGGARFDFRLQRQKISSAVGYNIIEDNRSIKLNDFDWVFDGNSKLSDAQNPTDAKPNKAFRIDGPGTNAGGYFDLGFRGDFREIAQWHNGTLWVRITSPTNAEWFCNYTIVYDAENEEGAKGGTNNHGSGGAENCPNAKPVARAGDDQSVDTGAAVELDGSGSDDLDIDTLTYHWTQTSGPAVTLVFNSSEKPTFTAPASPATLIFDLKVKDITDGLYNHKPSNSESLADSVTITVTDP